MAFWTMFFSGVEAPRIRTHYVFPVRHGAKVSRIDTYRSIAHVVYFKPLWNWPVYHFIRNTMSIDNASFTHDYSVTGHSVRTHPQPTGIGFVDSLPKSSIAAFCAFIFHIHYCNQSVPFGQ